MGCRSDALARGARWEGLKHSSATRLKSVGADDRLLAQLIGHRDARSVEKYAKLQGTSIQDALRRLRPDRG